MILRLLRVFCLLMIGIKSVYAVEPTGCEPLLTRERQIEIVQQEFHRLSDNQNGFQQMILQAGRAPLVDHILRVCSENKSCTEKDIAEATKVKVLQFCQYSNQAKGYAVLIATMVGSAALASHLTSMLPDSAKYLSQLIGQLSAIGIYVFGAPIWEPMSSGFRKWAFGFSSPLDARSVANSKIADLEKQWDSTQTQYSQNAQMSRNVINNFILATRQNFESAYRAMNEPDALKGRHYTVDQIADAAVRMRRLFAEISPDDADVSRAVHTSFSRHVHNPADLQAEVLNRIGEFDAEIKKSANQVFYTTLLQSWLNPQ